MNDEPDKQRVLMGMEIRTTVGSRDKVTLVIY